MMCVLYIGFVSYYVKDTERVSFGHMPDCILVSYLWMTIILHITAWHHHQGNVMGEGNRTVWSCFIYSSGVFFILLKQSIRFGDTLKTKRVRVEMFLIDTNICPFFCISVDYNHGDEWYTDAAVQCTYIFKQTSVWYL